MEIQPENTTPAAEFEGLMAKLSAHIEQQAATIAHQSKMIQAHTLMIRDLNAAIMKVRADLDPELAPLKDSVLPRSLAVLPSALERAWMEKTGHQITAGEAVGFYLSLIKAPVTLKSVSYALKVAAGQVTDEAVSYDTLWDWLPAEAVLFGVVEERIPVEQIAVLAARHHAMIAAR